MPHKIKWKCLGISIAISMSIAIICILITNNHMLVYTQVNKPFLAPSKEWFKTIWLVLYFLMGISAYLIYQANDYMKMSALYMYATQLLVNFTWPILFFNFNQYFLTFLILLLLWLMVVIMIAAFSSINKLSAYIQLPYIIWITFALYLNFGICILNI